MLNYSLASALSIRAIRALGLFALVIAGIGLTPSYAQNLTLIFINPSSAAPGTNVSVSASGFTPNVPIATATVTLSPQGGGAPLTVTGNVLGTDLGRTVNFVSPSGPAGPYSVTVSGPGLSSSNSLPFTLTGPPAFSLNPNIGSPTQTLQVTITPQNTIFPPNLTTANFGAGISVGGALEGQAGPVVVQPNGTAIATLIINGAAALGPRTVTVTGAAVITQANAFTVAPGTRTLTLVAVTPASSAPNTIVSITASGFEIGAPLATLTVTMTPVGGGPAVTATGNVLGTDLGRSVNFVVPVGTSAGVNNLTVAGSGYVSGNSLPFTVTGPASFTLNPNSAVQAQTVQVVITGQNTTFPAGLTTVAFGAGISVGGAAEGQAGAVAVQPNGTAIATLVIGSTAPPGPRSVTLFGADTITIPGAFTVLAGPQIVSVTPSSGQTGQTLSVTISGVNTTFSGASIVSFGPGITTNSVSFNNPASLTANITISAGATIGPRDVTVTTNGSPVTGFGLFAVTGSPRIVSVTPPSGQQAQTVNIAIVGENVVFSGSPVVAFGVGIVVNSVNLINGTTLNANVSIDSGAAAGIRDVTVTTNGTPLMAAGAFTVTQRPAQQLLSVVPGTAQAGTTLSVTITGVNTNFTNASAVSFGAGVTVNSVAANSQTSLTTNITVAAGAASGARDVTVTTGGTPVVGPGLFTVTAAPAQIRSVLPSSAGQGETATVVITGANTNFSSGSSVSFGSGVTVNSFTIGSPTSITATVSVAPGAILGLRDVIVTTNGTAVTGAGMFSVTQVPPAIIGVAPNSGQQGQTLAVTITGTNTQFAPTSVVSLGSSITVNSITFNSATRITASISIANNATLGLRDITVTSEGSSVSRIGVFTVVAKPAEQIVSVIPNSTRQGDTVSVLLTGSGTNFSSASTVSFGPGVTINSVTFNSATSLSATLTIAPNASTGPRDVSVTTSGSTVTGVGLFTITVLSPPSITGVTPNSIQQGRTISVAITGTDTSFTAASTVSFGPGITVNSVVFNSATNLTASVTAALNATVGPRDVTVTTNGTPVVGAGLFSVTSAGSITGVTPNSGQPGQNVTVTITGSNTNFSGSSTLSLGSGVTVNSVTINSATSITANISIAQGATVGTRDVAVITGGVTATGVGLFNVTPGTAPRITSISPNIGQPGQTITVVVTGSNTNFGAGSTANFGPGITVNSITANSGTSLSISITIAANATLGSRTVAITTGSETAALANAFSVVTGVSNQPLTCAVNAGVPPLLRAEGFTELVGDIVIVCTGGTAGLTNNVNLQVFLNTPITSRLIGGLSEALLIVDDVLFYRASPAQGDNALVWAGIPITAPGGNGQRVLRIVNVRANASAVGASNSLIPSQVFAFISASPSQSLPLNNPQQVVGFVQPGLQFDVRNCNDTQSLSPAFAQCVGENSLGSRNLTGGTAGDMQFALRFREGFQTAFKARITANQNPSTPGVVYNSESGFLRTPDLPFEVGAADAGTRFAARFNNLPNGTRIFVTTVPVSSSTDGFVAALARTGPTGEGALASITGTATLFCPVLGGQGVAAAELTVTNGSALAVWEVTAANPAALETALFGVAIAYAPNTPNNPLGLGQASVRGSFAPFYAPRSDAGRMSVSLPIPWFVDTAPAMNAFRIDPCVTNLLFPFVTNRAGFDTGIAISNTSRDPFGNPLRPQAGNCTVNYYGATAGGGPAPNAQQTNAPIPAGVTLTFVTSSGGNFGIAGTPGFQGYLIVQCEFRYGHGFAFITDGPIGSARVVEGYLGLVMDNNIPARGSSSEAIRQ